MVGRGRVKSLGVRGVEGKCLKARAGTSTSQTSSGLEGQATDRLGGREEQDKGPSGVRA